MKIVIINGSARKGNTLTAINAFIKGASEKNEIEIIEPDKLNIAPCKGCGVCQCSKGCVDKDLKHTKNGTRKIFAGTDACQFHAKVSVFITCLIIFSEKSVAVQLLVQSDNV
jgi:multimeric flavodoxin WrbA